MACRGPASRQQHDCESINPSPSIAWQVFQLKAGRGEAGGSVAGCRVSDGALKAAMQFRILRDGAVRAKSQAPSYSCVSVSQGEARIDQWNICGGRTLPGVDGSRQHRGLPP